MESLIYIENRSTDPAYNLALEEFLFRSRKETGGIFLLWRNEPAVVVGRNQNTAEEIDPEIVEKYGIHVVRRISGGGAVYHDLGNLNYTFLHRNEGVGFDFARFTEPIIQTLAKLDVHAENGGRNDLFVAGRKISGNAQYKCGGRLLHHGSILFDSDLNRLAKVLRAPSKEYLSNAIASVRSRVANITEFLQVNIDVGEFQRRILEEVRQTHSVQMVTITDDDQREIERLRDEKYRCREWNYGDAFPPVGNRIRKRKFGWGTLEIRMEIRDDRVGACSLFGDFFSENDPAALSERLLGLDFDRRVFEDRLSERLLREVFPDLTKDEFLDMIFQPPE